MRWGSSRVEDRDFLRHKAVTAANLRATRERSISGTFRAARRAGLLLDPRAE